VRRVRVVSVLPRAEASLLRTAGSLVSPGGRSGALLVVMYHRVLAAPDPLLPDEPDVGRFAAEVDLLRQLFTVVGFSDAVERLAAGVLPPRAVAITFDDGYANNLQLAAPILAARGLVATFFVSTGFIDGGRMWNDTVIEAIRQGPARLDLGQLGLGDYRLDAGIVARRQAIGDILGRLKYLDLTQRQRCADAIGDQVGLARTARPMMSAEQLAELAALGMEIGAHTVRHPILARLQPDEARAEILDSKRRLEEIVGRPVSAFAYPNGRPGTDYGPEHAAMVRDAGFTAAASTAWGAAVGATDRYQIPRVAPWDRSPRRYALRMLRAFTQRQPRAF
jgi:peptidoglycan/xylan/chitin deacetylase (PgdA/CDA1 family)